MASPARRNERPAALRRDGFILLDKPAGMSSNQALQRVKRLVRAARAGHTGSLDPLATGLLPICLGRATRLSQFLLDARKGYVVTGRLGQRTATGDAEGDVVETGADQVSEAALRSALDGFRGDIEQIPPMYSALKRDGQRLYRLARAGLDVERRPRPITIHALELLGMAGPDFTLAVECSKGTYIRTLVEDIAARLGTCAYVVSLRRTMVWPFMRPRLWSLDDLEGLAAAGDESLASAILPPDSALDKLPALDVSAAAGDALLKGQKLLWNGPPGIHRVYAPWGFLGIAERSDDGLLSPRRMFPPDG
jgi:tRNA pseudouridine55 synthase